MEVERIIDPNTGKIGMWAYDWDMSQAPARKINYRFLEWEQPVTTLQQQITISHEAVCWSWGRTLGNIAVSNTPILGSFPAPEGDNAILRCDIVEAGKMRNGKNRWWCRTHQKHWGTKADITHSLETNCTQCSNHRQPMSYVVNPKQINLRDHAEVGIWCSMPPAITNIHQGEQRHPRIHLHIRDTPEGPKVFDDDVKALTILYNQEDGLFGSSEITKVHITPPSALEFILALEQGRKMGCISCRDCGHPHLDLGDFARTEHKKHLCGNCGRDNTWSAEAIASTPLKPLHDQFSKSNSYTDVDKSINLDEYSELKYQVWASTPAILWTASRPQERGIHVHVYDGQEYLIDDTFGSVFYRGKRLIREQLLQTMIANTIG